MNLFERLRQHQRDNEQAHLRHQAEVQEQRRREEKEREEIRKKLSKLADKYLVPPLTEASKALWAGDVHTPGFSDKSQEENDLYSVRSSGKVRRRITWDKEDDDWSISGKTIELSIDTDGNISGFNEINVSITDPDWRQKVDDAIVDGVEKGLHRWSSSTLSSMRD